MVDPLHNVVPLDHEDYREAILTRKLPFKLGGAKLDIFLLLMRRTVVSMDTIYTELWSTIPEADQPPDGRANIAVNLSQLRKVLRPYGIEILNEHGLGWRFSLETKQKIRAMARGELTAAEAMADVKSKPVPTRPPVTVEPMPSPADEESRRKVTTVSGLVYVIEKGVPPPVHNARQFPWEFMENGESCFIEDVPTTTIRASISNFKKSASEFAEWKFLVRTVDSGGTRIWRIN
jgi:hypothetical protein